MSRRDDGRRMIGLVIVVVSVLTALVVTGGRQTPTVEASGPQVDLLVGDSVMAGMNSTARSALGPHVFDARVCRRLVSSSCSYQGSTPANAISVVRANAGRYDRALVVGVGYNDGSIASAVDTIVAEARRQGIDHVVWLTYRVAGGNAGTYRAHNSVLWTKANQYPELRVADWASFSAGRSDWVAADGLHLNAAGARAMASLLSSVLATIEPPPPTRCDLAAGGEPLPARSSAVSTSAPAGIVIHDRARRLADTRTTEDGMVRAGTALRVPVPSTGRSGTEPVIVTVVGVDPCGPGYLTAFACDTPMPGTATLNMSRVGATASTTIVDVGPDGSLCVATSVTTDIVVDLTGHLAPSGDLVRPIEPVRLIDTRPGHPAEFGSVSGARSAGAITAVAVSEAPGVEADDTGVVLNVASVGPTGPGWVSVQPGPCGGEPGTSNLNHVAETTAGAVIADIGDDGTVCIYQSAASHLVVDLTGTIGADGSKVEAVQNVRVVDTRSGGPDDGVVTVPGAGVGADGAFLNVAVLGEEPGYLTVRSCSVTGVPGHATLNHRDDIRANLALAGAPPSCVYRHRDAHVVVDVVARLRSAD